MCLGRTFQSFSTKGKKYFCTFLSYSLCFSEYYNYEVYKWKYQHTVEKEKTDSKGQDNSPFKKVEI